MARLSVLLLCGVLSAQEMTLNVDSNLVVVAVSARDKTGRQVTNLTKDSFLITEDGIPQAIAVFDPHSISTKHSARLPATLATEALTAQQSPSDRLKEPNDHRFISLLFDLTSMGTAERQRAENAAIKFVGEQMASRDLVSVITFGGALNIVQEFTDNRESLLVSLRKIRQSGAGALREHFSTVSREGGASAASQNQLDVLTSEGKLRGLESAVEILGSYPGRKALVYFSDGVEKIGINSVIPFRTLFRNAVRANVAFYPIDARGLVALPPGGDASSSSSRGSGIFSGTTQQTMRSSFYDSQETLYTLAAETGGIAFLDSNDLTAGLRRAEDDMSTYYELGYYSANTAVDGTYRRLRIQLVNGGPADLSYRRGYYASPKTPPPSLRHGPAPALNTSTSAPSAFGSQLGLQVDYLRITEDRYLIRLPSTVGAVYDHDNCGVIGPRHVERNVAANLQSATSTASQTADELAQSANCNHRGSFLLVSPGSYRFIGAARTGESESVNVESLVSVPELQSGNQLQLSSLILTSDREDLLTLVNAADDVGNPDAVLKTEVFPVAGMIADTAGSFKKNQTLHAYFEVYSDLLSEPFAPAAELKVMTGSQTVYVSLPIRGDHSRTIRPGVARFRFDVPLKDLSPADYVVQASVVDERNHRFAFARKTIKLKQ
jgi:VWFA-related protein